MKLILVRLNTLWISPAADPAPRKEEKSSSHS